MEILHNLNVGFSLALGPGNIVFAFLGSAIGFIVGVLPGFGPATGMAVMIPMTFFLNPTSALIMFATMYSSAFFGGAVTAILLSIPGEAAAVVTIFEGHPMAKQGRGAVALGMAAFASAIGGAVGIVFFMVAAPVLSSFALNFGPPEYVSIVIFSLYFVCLAAGPDFLKNIIAALLGLVTATIGIDLITGTERFTFGLSLLQAGIDDSIVLIGLFAFGEMFMSTEEAVTKGPQEVYQGKIRMTDVLPSWKDWKDSIGALGRGSILGVLVGCIPGAGASIASFVAYYVEKKFSKHPEKFGTGVIEGLASPEAANNSVCASTMTHTLVLGIPGGASTAVMLGALMLHGIRPGPSIFLQHHNIIWGLICGMYVGNFMSLVIGLTCNGLMLRILKLPYALLVGGILPLCVIGIYAMDNSTDAIWLSLLFGVIGYVMGKLNMSTPTFVLAVILGPMLEGSLRQSVMIYNGDVTRFLDSGISTFFFGATFLAIIIRFFLSLRNRRNAQTGKPDVRTTT